jgi:uncharacterized sulfatase
MGRSLLALFLAACSQAPHASQVDATPPNILLIISDDQHWSDFGFQGSEIVRTPHLDGLAAEGLTFSRGYVAAPLCRSSLATLATGLHAHQHKITGNDPPRGTPREAMLAHIDAATTLPELLREAGYRSMQTGKWWEGAATRGGFDVGMTHGDPARGGRHGDEGLKVGRQGFASTFAFLDQCTEAGAPWFLWYAPFLPHTPHNPPERWLAEYRAEDVPLPVAKYRAMCAWFDETCGELFAYLERTGQRDNTLIILVTDNGWIQREDRNGYAPRSKRTAYEGGVRTPIVVSWPGRIQAQHATMPVSSVDVPATILACAGLEVPASWPGHDLRDFDSDVGKTRGPVFGAAYQHDVVDIHDPAPGLVTRYVVDRRHKLLVHTDAARPAELYDLLDDPAELRPLDDPATIERLRASLDAWWTPTKR